jgi:uncharacterized protein YbjT (DUF2867 family)
MQKILFIGATGMLGKPVAKELIRAGFDVTLLARDVNKAKALFPDGKIIHGDVFNKASLLTAMTDMEAVYCSLSVEQTSKEKDQQPEREGIDNIIAAAKETGLGSIAYLSSLVHCYEGMNNFSWWAFRIKESAIQKIKTSGISYTIFYPSTFMEAYPYQMMQGNRIAMLGNSEAPMWFIAASDYAKQVISFFKMVTNENKEYSIQGLEPFTFGEANKIVIDNYQRAKLKVMKAPIALMKFAGNFNQRLNYAWHICEALNKYPEKFESEQTWKELGKPVITLKDFIAGL